MGSNPPLPPPAGGMLPPKPWERGGTSSGASPFKPPSSDSTSNAVESSGTAKPGEVVPSSQRNAIAGGNTPVRPMPPSRPWESNYGNGYGGGMYSSYGGFGGPYGGGLYGNSMYNRGYGGLYGGSGMYGGGYGGYSGPMSGPGTAMGALHGGGDPNNHPPSPPGFWISFLRVFQGTVEIFGRIAMLIDQNTQALHMFMSALLQLFDRSGLLYGELARFAFRLLGIRTKPRKLQQQLAPGSEIPGAPAAAKQLIDGPKSATGSWESVWGEDDAVVVVKGSS